MKKKKMMAKGKQVKKKMMAKGKMVKKMMAGGKAKKGYSNGGKLKMVEGKDGKQVPFYAADGVGKMKAGGMTKKSYKRGRKVMKDDTSLNEGQQGSENKNTMDKIIKGAAMLTPFGSMGSGVKSAAEKIKKRKDSADNFKAGKMVKKGMAAGGKAKGAAKGGKSKVRGAGIARKGVRPVKMR